MLESPPFVAKENEYATYEQGNCNCFGWLVLGRRASCSVLADAPPMRTLSFEVGAKDELGSGNLMKPEMALRAAKLIHTGEVFQLGFDLSGELPLIGSRRLTCT